LRVVIGNNLCLKWTMIWAVTAASEVVTTTSVSLTILLSSSGDCCVSFLCCFYVVYCILVFVNVVKISVKLINSSQQFLILGATLMVLSPWLNHCETWAVSSDTEPYLVAANPQSKTSESVFITGVPLWAAIIFTHYCHVILLSTNADTHFNIPRSAEVCLNWPCMKFETVL